MAVARRRDRIPLGVVGGLLLAAIAVAAAAPSDPPPPDRPAAATSVDPSVVPADTADGQRAFDTGDFARARAIWSGLAAHGDGVAAMDLAALLDQGNGVARDPAGALQWYRVAAEHGLPEAEFDVAVMLDSGRGGARDVALAATWYGRAAAHGQRRAQYNLGQLYDSGEGVPRNPDAARSWYRLAAANGVLAAMARGVPPTGVPSATASTDLANVAPQAPPADQEVAALPPNGDVEFVWAAPPQPVPVTFFIEVDALTGQGPRPAVSRYVAETAVALDLGKTAGDFVWRVYVVDSRRQHYAIGGWQRFSIKALASAG